MSVTEGTVTSLSVWIARLTSLADGSSFPDTDRRIFWKPEQEMLDQKRKTFVEAILTVVVKWG